jgi:hypothetical protein
MHRPSAASEVISGIIIGIEVRQIGHPREQFGRDTLGRNSLRRSQKRRVGRPAACASRD